MHEWRQQKNRMSRIMQEHKNHELERKQVKKECDSLKKNLLIFPMKVWDFISKWSLPLPNKRHFNSYLLQNYRTPHSCHLSLLLSKLLEDYAYLDEEKALLTSTEFQWAFD
jgi:hypothetical protein